MVGGGKGSQHAAHGLGRIRRIPNAADQGQSLTAIMPGKPQMMRFYPSQGIGGRLRPFHEPGKSVPAKGGSSRMAARFIYR